MKWQLESDLLRLRLQHGRTLAPLADGTGPVALIVSLHEYVFSMKLEGMLAKAFELQGLAPVFLVPSGSVLPRRYLQRFGARRFVELPDYIDEEIVREAEREAVELARGFESMQDLMTLSYRGATIGRYVASTVSMMRREGAVDLADPRTRAMVEEQIAIAVRSTLAATAILEDLEPKLVFFNDRNYAVEAPLSDLALERGLNVVQWVAAFQDDALVFKRYTAETRRVHPRSLSEASWERVKQLDWTANREAALDREFARRYDGSQYLVRRNQEWTQPCTQEEITRELGLDPAKKTAVVFSHVLWDANMFYGEDLFDDQESWFVETVRAACANPRVNWVIKVHPANVWKRKQAGATTELSDLGAIREHVGDLPSHVKLLLPDSTIATRSLFDMTDWGITIRGSVGIELPCFGIPVVTAGTGFYSGRGFTVDSRTAAEYLQRLASIEEIPSLTPDDVRLARKHACGLFLLRPCHFTSFRPRFRPLSEIQHPINPDLIVTAGSHGELERAEDLHRFGDWAVNSRELDYLELTDRR